jgi:hypothetical protein
VAVVAAVAFPVLARARMAARESVCMLQMQELTSAALAYASEHAGKLPTRTGWRTQLRPYLKQPIAEMGCPISGGKTLYAYNKNIGGADVNRIVSPGRLVMFFEGREGLPSASGSRADAIMAHNGCGYFAFADAHVEQRSDAPPQYQWVPKLRPATKAPVKKPMPKPRARRGR